MTGSCTNATARTGALLVWLNVSEGERFSKVLHRENVDSLAIITCTVSKIPKAHVRNQPFLSRFQ